MRSLAAFLLAACAVTPSTWPVPAPPEFTAASHWIGAATDDPADPWLRRTFDLPAAPRLATARVASIGYHELWVNGEKVGDEVLLPSVSELSLRARQVDYDLTSHLRAGKNAIVLWLGSGWGGFPDYHVAKAPLVRAEFAIDCGDGSALRIATDEAWRERSSPSRRVGTWRVWDYGGERVDANRALPGFASPELDDNDWSPVGSYAVDVAVSPDVLRGNRCVEELQPVAVEPRGENVWRVDFGRSFTGWFEAELTGKPGATVSIQVSERDDAVMSYNQRSELVLPASGRATFRNRFNYASGRWYTLTGCEPPIAARGWLVRSPYARTLEFACSDPLLSRIQATAAWTFECLSLGGMVVDCPQRERRGYGGDAHATMRTALTHFDMHDFYVQWLEDWRDVQGPDGNIPYTAPTRDGGGGPAWSGVCIRLPWDVYVHTGDVQVLADNWPMMQRWLAFLRTQTTDGLLHRYGHPDWGFLGDWVPPGRGQGAGERVDEDTTLFFNQAYWLWSLHTAARIARVLGDGAAAANLLAEAEALRDRVQARWYHPDGSYANGEQPYMALALLAELPPPELRAQVFAALERQIRDKRHIDAGIHGHRFVIDVLTQYHRDDLVALMAQQTDFPSWGDMLRQGATTLWEQWDGQESRLHSSFLGIGAWFVEGLAGIRADPAHPGYARVLLRPGVDSGVQSARARLRTVRGDVRSDWQIDGDRLRWDIEVPPGASALVTVPYLQDRAVTFDGESPDAAGAREVPGDGDGPTFELGPGRRRIEARVVVGHTLGDPMRR